MRIPILIGALALAGCSATYTEPLLPADHPANASAREASPLPRSRTLDLAAGESGGPMPAGVHEMDHSGDGAHAPDTADPQGHQHGTSGHDNQGPEGVRWIGELHKTVHDGDIAAKVRLADLAAVPHLFAVGPLAGLKGEITVIDGRVSVATVRDGAVQARDGRDDSAAFLVYAHAEAWKTIPMPDQVRSFADVEGYIPSAAQHAGMDADSPIAIAIEGTASTLSYHVLDLPDGAPASFEAHEKAKFHAAIKDQPVRLVGFFSTHHRGVFTPGNSDMHIHFVTADGRVSGHVEAFELTPGAMLRLALPQPTQEAAAALYACPMHSEVTSDKPDQRCRKCGMKLKKVEGGTQP